jgi:Domain of unknown function (DUF5666)
MRFWCTLAVSLVVALAQEPAQQRKNTDGEVQSADAAAKQLIVKTAKGDVYTVKTDDKTNFLRVGADLDLKKATKIALSDVAAGDRVRARGVVADDTKTIAASTVVVMTKADIAQKQQRDRDEWIKRGVAGTVTAIDPDKREIAIKVDTIPPKIVVVEVSEKVDFRRYAPDSVKFSDAKQSAFAELKVGDRLRALADKNPDGTRYKAEEIVSGSFLTVAVQVVSIDPATNIVKATNLSTPKDKQPLTIQVNADTVVRRMPEQMAMMMARRLNATTSVPGPGGPAGPGGPGGGPGGRGPGGPAGPPAGPGANLGQMGSGPGATGGGRGGDLHQMIERLPKVEITELKAGDALIISSTNGADRYHLMAISIVAGVEPVLASAPRTAGAVNLGAWSFDIGMPAQ